MTQQHRKSALWHEVRSFALITIACAMVSVTFFGRHCRISDGTTPVVKLGRTNESFLLGRSARKSPTS